MLPLNTKTTNGARLPKLRARYALALIQTGCESVVTRDDQKRLLASRLVRMSPDGTLTPTVRGVALLNNAKV